ncbi:MAG: universal stress protein [Nitrospirales bacterium]
MQKYQDILFVSTGMTDETDALKQALSIARNNQASLTALIIHPKFPSHLADYEKKHEQALMDELRATIQKVSQEIGVDSESMTLTMEAERKTKPAISIIKHVLKGSVDLVIKQAEQKDSGKGFKALDMDLLRQCPCPVWLCRPIEHHRQDIKIAVAIDAESETDEGRDLSIRLLTAADAMATDCNNAITVISCWEYEFEEYLKHNAWAPLPEDRVAEIVMEAGNNNLSALRMLMRQAGIVSKTDIHHIKGQPEEIIPQFIEDHTIDILVMGTVARSGLLGFIIGNTAENVLQKVGCSLLALKPNGFVSPVKAY